MTKKTYKAKQGAHLTDKDAANIAQFFSKKKFDAPFKAQALLDAARPKRSKFQHLFEWNNTEAAEKYRLHQARQLIASAAPFFAHFALDSFGA